MIIIIIEIRNIYSINSWGSVVLFLRGNSYSACCTYNGSGIVLVTIILVVATTRNKENSSVSS